MRLTRRMVTTAIAVAVVSTLAVLGGGSAQAIDSQGLPDPISVVAPPDHAEAVAFVDAVNKLESSVVRQDDGTLSVVTTAAKVGVSEELFRLVVDSVDELNRLVRKGEVLTTADLNVQVSGDDPHLLHNGVIVRWWGLETHLDSELTNRVLGLMAIGAGTSTLVALLAPSVGARFAGTIAIAIFTLGIGVIQVCSNRNGVVIVKPYVGPVWCHGH